MSMFKSKKDKEKLSSVIKSQGVEWWINLENILFMHKKEDLYPVLGQKQALILQMREQHSENLYTWPLDSIVNILPYLFYVFPP